MGSAQNCWLLPLWFKSLGLKQRHLERVLDCDYPKEEEACWICLFFCFLWGAQKVFGFFETEPENSVIS